jgi:SAM-dependent methyltransferase
MAAIWFRRRQEPTVRQTVADDLIAPHLTLGSRVVDYGCGTGYLAAAVARQVARVDAIDISRGALACARALNGLHNITYQTLEEFRVPAIPSMLHTRSPWSSICAPMSSSRCLPYLVGRCAQEAFCYCISLWRANRATRPRGSGCPTARWPAAPRSATASTALGAHRLKWSA